MILKIIKSKFFKLIHFKNEDEKEIIQLSDSKDIKIKTIEWKQIHNVPESKS